MRGASPRMTNPANSSLPQRLQNLHQLAVDEFIAADQISGLERIVVAFDAADGAAGFTYHDLPGRHVPGLQVALPIAVEPASGDEGHVQRGRAEPAQASDLVLDRGHLQARQIMIAASEM